LSLNCLVVGATSPRTAEQLLTHDCSRGLVVDVEVSGGESQHVHRLDDGSSIGSDDRTGQPVRPNCRGLPQHFVVFGVLVDEHAENRTEVFGSEYLMIRIVGHHDVGGTK